MAWLCGRISALETHGRAEIDVTYYSAYSNCTFKYPILSYVHQTDTTVKRRDELGPFDRTYTQADEYRVPLSVLVATADICPPGRENSEDAKGVDIELHVYDGAKRIELRRTMDGQVADVQYASKVRFNCYDESLARKIAAAFVHAIRLTGGKEDLFDGRAGPDNAKQAHARDGDKSGAAETIDSLMPLRAGLTPPRNMDEAVRRVNTLCAECMLGLVGSIFQDINQLAESLSENQCKSGEYEIVCDSGPITTYRANVTDPGGNVFEVIVNSRAHDCCEVINIRFVAAAEDTDPDVVQRVNSILHGQ